MYRTKTVYAQFEDYSGYVSTASATILLDTTVPTAGTCTPPASVAGGTSTIAVPFSGASDAGSGLNHVELWYRYATSPGTTGTWMNSGLTATAGSGTFTFTPSSGSGWYYFALVAQDNAGNRSAAATGTGSGPTIFRLLWSDGFESNNLTAGVWITAGSPSTQSTYVYAGSYAAPAQRQQHLLDNQELQHCRLHEHHSAVRALRSQWWIERYIYRRLLHKRRIEFHQSGKLHQHQRMDLEDLVSAVGSRGHFELRDSISGGQLYIVAVRLCGQCVDHRTVRMSCELALRQHL